MTPVEEAEALLASANETCQFRTVISRAYYASFRRLIGVCTPLGFRQNDRSPQGTPHLGVHARLQSFTTNSHVPILKKIGHQLLKNLYRLRIKADYGFTTPMTRGEAQEAVAIAIDIEDWLADSSLETRFA